MVLKTIDFNNEQHEKILFYANKWKVSQNQAVKMLVEFYKEQEVN